MRAPLAGSLAGIAVGAVFVVYALQYPLGSLGNPGEGLVPLLVAGLLLLCSIGAAIEAWRQHPGPEGPVPDPAARRRILSILGALALFASLLKPAGYLAATAVLCFVLLRTFGFRTWRAQLLAAAALTAGSYLLFGTVLGLQLPLGALFY